MDAIPTQPPTGFKPPENSGLIARRAISGVLGVCWLVGNLNASSYATTMGARIQMGAIYLSTAASIYWLYKRRDCTAPLLARQAFLVTAIAGLLAGLVVATIRRTDFPQAILLPIFLAASITCILYAAGSTVSLQKLKFASFFYPTWLVNAGAMTGGALALAMLMHQVKTEEGISPTTSPTNSVAKPQGPPPLLVSPNLLHSAYARNEVAADMKFRGRTLLVFAEVESVNLDFIDNVYLNLYDVNDPSPFFLTVATAILKKNQEQKASTLRRGDVVHLLCDRVQRIMGIPALSECEFTTSAAVSWSEH